MDPQLKAQLNQTLWVATLAFRDEAGDPTFNAAAAVLCRCEPDEEESESAAGEERVTRYRIVTEGPINKTDRVWLPGDDHTVDAMGRTPMKVQPCFDERGALDHCETIV
jgi:hypothetical protein